jgi:putative ABC transport system substrate-binding protein
MGRREFITLIGGMAISLRLTARAQQSATPVVGFLSSRPQKEAEIHVTAFRRSLSEAGFADGQDAAIEYRWTEETMSACRRSRADEVIE